MHLKSFQRILFVIVDIKTHLNNYITGRISCFIIVSIMHSRPKEETWANYNPFFQFAEVPVNSNSVQFSCPCAYVGQRRCQGPSERASERALRLPRSPISFALTHSLIRSLREEMGISGRFALKLSFLRKRADDPAVAA